MGRIGLIGYGRMGRAIADRLARCELSVVVFDTSASQTGGYRQDALEALQSMLGELLAEDRIKLVAADLKAIPLTDEFVAPRSGPLQAALAKLERRVPLGSDGAAEAHPLPAGIDEDQLAGRTG